MKKIFAVIPIAIIIVLLLSPESAFAYEYVNSTANISLVHTDKGWYAVSCDQYTAGEYPVLRVDHTVRGRGWFPNLASGYWGYGDYQSCINALNNQGYLSSSSYTYYCDTIVVYKGQCYIESGANNSGYYGSVQEYEDFLNPPPDPTWYESLFSDFLEYVGAGIAGGIEGFLDWLTDAWTVPVGEGENELSLDLITPTPIPTPLPTPTPIPYTTTFVPDGSGGFNVTYNYYDNNGNPTSAPMPPTNAPFATSAPVQGDNFDYPYYNNPNNSDDPYELDIPWYLKFKFNGVTTSLNDFQGGIDATIDSVNDQEDNINVVMDSVGLFPSDWLLLIGFIGGIPLIGGLISRLLKG